MRQRRYCGHLLSAALFLTLAAPACGGDTSGGGCGVPLCGGDIVGTWVVVDVCDNGPSRIANRFKRPIEKRQQFRGAERDRTVGLLSAISG
jgi:hypothetical protein